MTKEDKKLLLKDLCARLPYNVKGKVYAEVSDGKYDILGDMIFYDAPFDVIPDEINVSTEEIHVVAIGNEDTVEFIEIQQTDGAPYTISDFKPYLRPMSSMTDEERNELYCIDGVISVDFEFQPYQMVHLLKSHNVIDWFNKHHFDYRDLINKGLAVEAPEGMYNIKDQ